jgi:hypothetical protein
VLFACALDLLPRAADAAPSLLPPEKTAAGEA